MKIPSLGGVARSAGVGSVCSSVTHPRAWRPLPLPRGDLLACFFLTSHRASSGVGCAFENPLPGRGGAQRRGGSVRYTAPHPRAWRPLPLPRGDLLGIFFITSHRARSGVGVLKKNPLAGGVARRWSLETPRSHRSAGSCEEIREGEAPAEPGARKLLIQDGSAGASPSHTNAIGIFHSFRSPEGTNVNSRELSAAMGAKPTVERSSTCNPEGFEP